MKKIIFINLYCIFSISLFASEMTSQEQKNIDFLYLRNASKSDMNAMERLYEQGKPPKNLSLIITYAMKDNHVRVIDWIVDKKLKLTQTEIDYLFEYALTNNRPDLITKIPVYQKDAKLTTEAIKGAFLYFTRHAELENSEELLKKYPESIDISVINDAFKNMIDFTKGKRNNEFFNVINFLIEYTRRFGNKQKSIRPDVDVMKKIFLSAAKYGQLETIKLLLNNYNDNFDSNLIIDGLISASENEKLEVMDYLSKQYKGSFDPTKLNEVLDRVIKSGKLNTIKWILDYMNKLHVKRINDIFKEAARNGYLDIIGWVSQTHKGVLVDDVIRYSFVEAAGRGQLKIIEWLADKYKDLLDIGVINDALKYAAGGRHLDVMKWLQTDGHNIPLPDQNIRDVKQRLYLSYDESLENAFTKLSAESYIHDKKPDDRKTRKQKLKELRKVLKYGSSIDKNDAGLSPNLLGETRKDHFKQYDDYYSNSPSTLLASTKFAHADFMNFSGILTLLDQFNLAGQGVNVFVSEKKDVNNVPILNCVNCAGTSTENHGVNVAGIIRKIAQRATLLAGETKSAIPENAHIVNLSWGVEATRDHALVKMGIAADYVKNAKDRKNSLFIRAIGNNDGEKLSEDIGMRNAETHKQQDSTVMDNMLFVVNVTSYGVLSHSSSVPGEEYKDHALSAIGTDVEVMNIDKTLTRVTGTSFSTPIVSGVAALLKGAFPSFTPFDLKVCLLESADSFMFLNYEQEDGYPSTDVNYKGKKTKLDPKKYGKGLLNANHGYLYARILNEQRQSNPEILPDDARVKKLYRAAVAREEVHASKTIVRNLKKSLEGRRIKKESLESK